LFIRFSARVASFRTIFSQRLLHAEKITSMCSNPARSGGAVRPIHIWLLARNCQGNSVEHGIVGD